MQGIDICRTWLDFRHIWEEKKRYMPCIGVVSGYFCMMPIIFSVSLVNSFISSRLYLIDLPLYCPRDIFVDQILVVIGFTMNGFAQGIFTLTVEVMIVEDSDPLQVGPVTIIHKLFIQWIFRIMEGIKGMKTYGKECFRGSCDWPDKT